ncbi:VWA domain-containing protein [Haliea sp. E17]|uniref:VWA domain-containing protein n=1 Tax=Haliea sp. E17 TaxID=3401576 RepID=UPI003AB0AA43
MRHRAGFPSLLPALLVLLLSSAVAAGAPPVIAAADLRLLVDASANMRDSDPDGQQVRDALRLGLALLPDGASAGVWLFADTVSELVPYGRVDDAWRRRAKAALAAYPAHPGGSQRDIPAALQAALFDLDTLDNTRRTSLLLLTDGRVTVARSPMLNAAAAREVLEQLAPQLDEKGISVHTIALADQVDGSFLQALAASTGGVAVHADTAATLPDDILRVLTRAADINRLPLADDGFVVDEQTTRISLLLRGERDSGDALRDPAGKRISLVSAEAGAEVIHSGDITLVTVDAPAPGTWQLAVAERDRAQVLLRAGLQLDALPEQGSRQAAGASVALRLQLAASGESPAPAFPGAAPRVDIVISGPDDTLRRIEDQAIEASADGGYRVVLPALETPGEYRVLVDFAAGDIRRQLPLFLEMVSADGQPTLVTRGDAPEYDGFRLPLLLLGSCSAAGLGLLWLVLRRRQRRKLEIWRRRAEQLRATPDPALRRAALSAAQPANDSASLESGPATQ